MRPRPSVLLVAGLLAGCAEEVASRQAAIIGGTIATSDLAVVALRMCSDDGSCSICSGTLVSRQSILTASHCLDTSLENVSGVSAFFGLSFGWVLTNTQRQRAMCSLGVDGGPSASACKDLPFLGVFRL